MIAGMSGAVCRSGGGVGPDEKDGRLILPQAPRKLANVQAIPRLRIARVLFELIMAFPPGEGRWPHPPRSQAQNYCRSNDVRHMAPVPRSASRTSYIGLTKVLSPA